MSSGSCWNTDLGFVVNLDCKLEAMTKKCFLKETVAENLSEKKNYNHVKF